MRTLLALLVTAAFVPAVTFLVWSYNANEGASWIGGRGRIGQAHFEPVLHDPADTLCFVCGPPALVSESVGTLQHLGVPPDLIHTEAWLRRTAGESV